MQMIAWTLKWNGCLENNINSKFSYLHLKRFIFLLLIITCPHVFVLREGKARNSNYKITTLVQVRDFIRSRAFTLRVDIQKF